MHTETEIGKEKVEFRLGDLSLDQQSDVLKRVKGDLELAGKVIDHVQLGEPPEAFVLLEVRGFKTPMLVPVAALR